jgi:hypothetical protein
VRWFLAATLAVGVACGNGFSNGPQQVEIGQLVANPASFADEPVRVVATFYEDPQMRVLAEALAESYPPQPAGATIWVEGRAPEGECISSDLGISWGQVEARGVFRSSESGGLGIPPIYDMALVDATLTCP